MKGTHPRKAPGAFYVLSYAQKAVESVTAKVRVGIR